MYIYVYIESYFVGILNYSLSRVLKGKEGGKEGEEGSVARNSKFWKDLRDPKEYSVLAAAPCAMYFVIPIK